MANASGAAKQRAQKKADTSEILTDQVRARQKAETSKAAVIEGDPRFSEIASNPFFSVMFAENSSPEAKRAAITKLLTFEGSKEENRERLKAFELFKEYLQSQREEMAQEIIRLTNTETFAELKSVYDDLNNSLLDFDNRMKPLTDIIDAVYTLRTNGLTLDAFQEIIRDRAREKELLERKAGLRAEFESLKKSSHDITMDVAALNEDRSLFGLGPVKQSARESIARKRQELADMEGKLGGLANEIAELDKQTPTESELGEFAAQKQKLRELLDISAEDHKQRQRDLVDAAVNFVNTAKTRVGSVRQHLG